MHSSIKTERPVGELSPDSRSSARSGFWEAPSSMSTTPRMLQQQPHASQQQGQPPTQQQSPEIPAASSYTAVAPASSSSDAPPERKTRTTRHRSTGCGTCRMRKIKCDEARPVCRNCQRTARECLGYRTEAELAHPQAAKQRMLLLQQQQQRMQQRQQMEYVQAAQRSLASLDGWLLDQNGQTHTYHADPSMIHDETRTAQLAVPLHPDLYQDYGQPLVPPPMDLVWNAQAMPTSAFRLESFFFRKFIGSVWLHAYSDMWRRMLPDVLVTSAPLYHSVLAMSAMFMYKSGIDVRAKDAAISQYAVAVKYLQQALYAPDEAFKDTTLMATVMMGFYEMLDKEEHRSWCAHTRGAQELIRMRGPKATMTGFGKMLYLTLRGFETVRAFLDYDETIFAEEAWTVPSTNPATRLLFKDLLGNACPPVTAAELLQSEPPDYGAVLYMLGSKAAALIAKARRLFKANRLDDVAKRQLVADGYVLVDKFKLWRRLLPSSYAGREESSTQPGSPYETVLVFEEMHITSHVGFYAAFLLQTYRLIAKNSSDGPIVLPPEAQTLARTIVRTAEYNTFSLQGVTTLSMQITWAVYVASIALTDRAEALWARRLLKAIASDKGWAIAQSALKANSVVSLREQMLAKRASESSASASGTEGTWRSDRSH